MKKVIKQYKYRTVNFAGTIDNIPITLKARCQRTGRVSATDSAFQVIWHLQFTPSINNHPDYKDIREQVCKALYLTTNYKMKDGSLVWGFSKRRKLTIDQQ